VQIVHNNNEAILFQARDQSPGIAGGGGGPEARSEKWTNVSAGIISYPVANHGLRV
jgi:hypothetical protein